MNILKDKILLVILILSGLFLIAGLVFITLKVGDFSSPVILHFDKFNGIDLFGEKGDLFGIWLSGLIILGLNTFLAEKVFYRERVLSYLIIGTNLLISILLFVALSTMVSVN